MVKNRNKTTKSRNTQIFSLLAGLAIGFVSLFFILTITSIIAFTLLFQRWWPVTNHIRQATNLTWSEVFKLAIELSEVEPRQTSMTWLILGTDQLAERGDKQPIFTDTILLARIEPIDQTVTLLSIPRDVWLPDQAVKINTTYQNNLTKYQSNHLARQQTLQDFSQIFDIPIDQLLVVDMKLVPQLIDALGGVEVNVETAFTDYNYPRSDVDVTVERDPRKLYETVSFKAGPNKLNGQTALKFMRSRKAQNSEGNDLARAKRQQQVITALINQLMASMPPQSAEQVIEYLNLYQYSLAGQLPLTELLKIAVSLPNSPLNYSFKTSSLPVIPIDKDGILVESPRHYSGQWVFEMTSLEDFQATIKNRLD